MSWTMKNNSSESVSKEERYKKIINRKFLMVKILTMAPLMFITILLIINLIVSPNIYFFWICIGPKQW